VAHIEYHSGTVSVRAACAPSDAVGDLVYVTGPAIAGVMQVSRVDIGNAQRLPAVGIITTKSSLSNCRVILSGVVPGAGLTPGARYFAGSDGRPTATRPLAAPGGRFIQSVGVALDEARLAIAPSTFLTKVIP
jgi:hypothetical protein